jgi:hypothetical protein
LKAEVKNIFYENEDKYTLQLVFTENIPSGEHKGKLLNSIVAIPRAKVKRYVANIDLIEEELDPIDRFIYLLLKKYLMKDELNNLQVTFRNEGWNCFSLDHILRLNGETKNSVLNRILDPSCACKNSSMKEREKSIFELAHGNTDGHKDIIGTMMMLCGTIIGAENELERIACGKSTYFNTQIHVC